MFSSVGTDAWYQHFGGWRAFNLGVAGDQTQNILWRIQVGQIDGVSPKVIVLMAGTSNDERQSAQDVVDGITAIVTALRQKQPQAHILLMAIFPRNVYPTDQHRMKNEQVNNLIAKLDTDGDMVKFLNINDKFLDKDGRLARDLFPDLPPPLRKRLSNLGGSHQTPAHSMARCHALPGAPSGASLFTPRCSVR